MSDRNTKREIKKLLDEIERLKKLAYRDELTGLYNRHGLKNTLAKFVGEIRKSKETKERRESVFIKDIAIVVFDIDDFKKLNDTYGHPAGDEVLRFFADIIGKNIRDIDLGARWGGEEILVALVGANEEDVYRVADRIKDDVKKSRFEFKGEEARFTVSGGVSKFDETKDLEENIEKADKALYEAKRSGKNKIIKFSDL
ncbi:hypothetical protein COV42_01615 [Candidatus Campbellbacteria bacterium CG11_big_fil_rev_8_21_14_0_20_44_21]|uniref:GGDEF domain-containing protein n=1 Tax=Candidatus Campbellbacteria bacterium CG22_combo_CG10-13_8_21_14_all_43_18 TaxID=1974530 RepID=A0A2H0DXL6_9BACT|nr:MAG: hypothetical protein COW82_02655 [Candidatus Campbellbacteria bacterium CG22_combo_CG10-13_8_21_14_all_43_18]PIR24274.1 MAG: hypothetical protein COV42_01615 [Candidatus Campbellbacteria bacterium CG11_big_fil_rev_8_21_14_0_20_44_21]